MRGRVLVTGAGGFVGTVLLKGLSKSGLPVRAVTRKGGAVPLAGETIHVAASDGSTDWTEAVDGISAVVHLAARVHRLKDDGPDSESAYRQVNTEGSLRLAEMAAAAGCRRFVFLSTVKVLGETGRFRGESVGQPPDDPYGRSKYDAEQGLRRLAETAAMKVVCLRPPLVYGPGVKANFLRLINWVHRGIPLPLGAVNNRRSLVYVGNLVNAIIGCLGAERITGFAYSVTDGEDISTPELIRHIAAAMGKQPRLVSVPAGLLRWTGTLAGKRAEVDRLTGDLVVTPDAFMKDFDWRPPYTVQEGIQATVNWFLNHRY